MSKQINVLILSDRTYLKFFKFVEDYLGLIPINLNKPTDFSYVIQNKKVRFINLVLPKYWSMDEVERELFKHKEISAIILYVMRDASVVGTWLNFLDSYFNKQTLQKVAVAIFTQRNWSSREQTLQKLLQGVSYAKFYFDYEATALFNGRDNIRDRDEWGNSGESCRNLFGYILEGGATNLIQLTPAGLALKITEKLYDLLEEMAVAIEENLIMLENYFYINNDYIGCNESKYLQVPLNSFTENSIFEILDVPGVEVKKRKRNVLLTISQCDKMLDDYKVKMQQVIETLVTFLLFKKRNFNRSRDHFLNKIEIKTNESQPNKNLYKSVRKQYCTLLAIEEVNLQEFTAERVIKCVERLKKLQEIGPVITEVYYKRITKELLKIPCEALEAVDPEIQGLEMIKSMRNVLTDFAKELMELRTVCKLNENYSQIIADDLKVIKSNQNVIKAKLNVNVL